ncbi:MAG TPA: hypothetical protein VJY15_05420 [Candidatus Acidoferrum sp.]|nr:hypothetical protein [Candidatus Acidoferrum sp.]
MLRNSPSRTSGVKTPKAEGLFGAAEEGAEEYWENFLQGPLKSAEEMSY